MKNVFLPLIMIAASFVIPFCCRAQMPVDSSSHLIVYTNLVKAENSTKADLYQTGWKWFGQMVKGGAMSVLMYDASVGEIIGSQGISCHYQKDNSIDSISTTTLYFSLALEFKDGKYRYTISDVHIFDVESNIAIYLDGKRDRWFTDHEWFSLKVYADANIRVFISDMETAMSYGPDNKW